MKKDKKENNNLLLDASSVGLEQSTGLPKIIFGMLCRFAVAYVGVTGVSLMLDDAFRFYNGESNPARVFLTAFICCAAFYLVFTAANTHPVAMAFGVFGLIVAFAALDMQNGLKQSFVYIPVSAWNHILMRLDSLGYSSMSGLVSQFPETNPVSSTGVAFVAKAFNSFIALASFIFVSCTYKRVRTVPIIITAGIVMTVTFTYNILTDNLGFTLMTASGFGIIVMKYCDVFQKAQREADKAAKMRHFAKMRMQVKHASTRGFAAFTAMAAVFAVAAYPMARINRPAPELTLFNDFMDSAREVVGTFLTGSGSVTGDDPYAGHKGTEPIPRSFRNRRVMTVTAMSDVPLYLRSWVGEEFKNNQWIAAGGSSDIAPEEVTDLFYTLVDIDAIVVQNQARFETETLKRGFAKEFVTIKTAEKKAYAYLPSRFSSIYGLTDPSDMNLKYTGYYTVKKNSGLIDFSEKTNSYGLVTYAQNYRRVSLTRLDKDMTVYNIIYPYVYNYLIKRTFNLNDKDKSEQIKELRETVFTLAQEANVEIPAGSIVNRLYDMTDEECAALYDKMTAAAIYEDSVFEKCLNMQWSDTSGVLDNARDACGISQYVYNDMVLYNTSQAAAYRDAVGVREGSGVMYDNPATRMSDIYTLADKTARYLSERCEYTLDPQGYSVYGSYVSQFLNTARNGYCVQFATAGALMLRSLGIPTRYVDGYIAGNMDYNGTTFSCKVLDSNAHAWIEVYVKGYGWMTFEMTAPMMSGMYSRTTPTLDPVTEPVYVTTTDTDTETTNAPHTTTGTDTKDNDDTTPGDTTTEELTPFISGDAKRILIIIGASLLGVIVISSVIYLYLKKTNGRKKKLNETIEKAAAGESADPESDIDKISAYIKLMLSKIDIVRNENELMTDFARRVDEETGITTFAPAADACQKNAFGHCADENDAKAAAEYAKKLRIHVLGKLSGAEKFYYVSLRKLI